MGAAKKAAKRKAPAKRSKSPAESPAVELVPQKHGGAIRRGSEAGNTPGTGRPPNSLRAFYRGLLARGIDDPKSVRKAIEAVLTDPAHPQFAAVLKQAQDRAHGPVEKRVHVSGNITLTLADRLKKARERAAV